MATNDNGDITVKIPAEYTQTVVDSLYMAVTNKSLDPITVKSLAEIDYLNQLAQDIQVTKPQDEMPMTDEHNAMTDL